MANGNGNGFSKAFQWIIGGLVFIALTLALAFSGYSIAQIDTLRDTSVRKADYRCDQEKLERQLTRIEAKIDDLGKDRK
jgi:Mn2+/Fe2+ NRAMP family transporter